jgi:major vault protein
LIETTRNLLDFLGISDIVKFENLPLREKRKYNVMAIDRDPRDRDRNDVILMPRQYAVVKDTTKGNLIVQVGPIKVTVSETDRLMAPDPKNPSRLIEVGNQDGAILPYVDVGESDYVVLSNPAASETAVLKPRTQNDMVDLQFGRKINIPGPVSFPLWPFQAVDVIKGHQLNMNQYLVVKVINDEEALKNWNKGVVKSADGKEQTKGIVRPAALSIGQLIIIKGTEVSFYIPPTGLEVVKDAHGQYVRDAVTLEQLEYCVLVDQNGEKRFEQGPKVVFPTASEEFIEEDNSKKYKATELTEISGLHIKVTAPYKEGDKSYKIGDELFVTGKDTPIYFPRAEHAIVKYGGRIKHYATAIPKGEGRYVMNRLTGEIRLIRGPKMLLPDPRTEVIIRRILSDKQVGLLYPGNAEALALNRSLGAKAAQESLTENYLSMTDSSVSGAMDMSLRGEYARSVAAAAATPTRFVGDSMSRKETYTPPRMVTLDTKYDGAVQVGVWTGYAVLVVDKNGNRQVVVGPQTVLLEFDQELASMEFSTGKPKTTDVLYKTSYLRVLNNQVSDIVDAMTSDDIPVRIKVSFRVNFLPEYKEKWFDAENYVKLLCDHVRSKLRNVVKKMGVQEFQDKYIDLVRDTVLGVSTTNAKGEKTHRPGLTFTENGAHVYDVEVLGLEIGDKDIANQLVSAQRQTIQDALRLATSKRQLVLAEEQEAITQKLESIRATTTIQKVNLQKTVLKESMELTLAEIARDIETFKSKQSVETEKQKIIDISNTSELERNKLGAEQAFLKLKEEMALRLQEQESETKNLAERTKALTPDMVAAMTRFSDMSLAEKMSESMAPMALLGGKSVKDVLSGLLGGTGLEKMTSALNFGSGNGNGNGNGHPLAESVRTR